MSPYSEPRRGRRRELRKHHYQGWNVEETKPGYYKAARPEEPDVILTASATGTMHRKIRKANEEAGRTHEETAYAERRHSDPETARREEELSRWEKNWVDPPWLTVESEPG